LNMMGDWRKSVYKLKPIIEIMVLNQQASTYIRAVQG
jgi:hypothetical protein